MKCYSLEELFDFAMNPLQEKNAEIASHLTRCKSCMEDYQLILDTLNEKDPELLPEEIAHAETVTRAFFAAKYNWNDFQNFIGRIANTLQEQVKRGLSFLNTANLFQAEPATLFAASGKELKGSASGAVPAITFEADTPQCSDYYWKIQMSFPSMLSQTAALRMKITDKTGSSMKNGTLLFLGKEFAVRMGSVSIPFKDFQNDKKCTSIGIRFADGLTTSGSIRFLPESYA